MVHGLKNNIWKEWSFSKTSVAYTQDKPQELYVAYFLCVPTSTENPS